MAFPPHPLHAMLYHFSDYLQETANTLTFNRVDGGGVWIVLFSEVTPFGDSVSKILPAIVALL